MPSKKPTPEADTQLSQLLRLKRQEKPDDAFWNKFDEELRSKQLAALVRTQTWYERVGKLSLLVARKSAAATAAVSVFALGIFVVSKSDYFASEEMIAGEIAQASASDTALETTPEAPLFVVEEFATSQENAENVFLPAIDAQPFYEIHAMKKQTAPVNYQIISAPKQFTVGGSATEATLGAKIIRTGNHF